MLGSKFLFIIPGLLIFSSLLSCMSSIDSEAVLNEHPQGAPAPHIPNVLKGRLNIEGDKLSLRLCSDTILLLLDNSDDKVISMLNKKNSTALAATDWIIELDGNTEPIDVSDSVSARYAARVSLYNVISMKVDSSADMCQ